MQARRKLLLIILLVIFAGLAVGTWLYTRSSNNMASQLTLYGNIDIRQVELSFHDPEHIAKMYVKEGDRVEKGQLLAIQDLERFQYQRERAEAKVEAQRQVVERLLAGTRPEEIRRAKADVKSAQATATFADKELNRMRSLYQKHLTSKESVDRARSETIAAREKMQALEEQLDLAIIGPRQEDIAEAKALLRAYQSDLKLAEKIWQDGHIHAPNRGIIQDRILEPGDMADSQTPVYTLALIDPVWARVYAPEDSLGLLRYGMPVSVSIDLDSKSPKTAQQDCVN